MSAQVQGIAPGFEAKAVVNNEIKNISLNDFKGRYVVLLFYPKDFTFVCPTEIIAFSDNYGKFKGLNADIIAISCDSENTHLAWLNTPRSKGGLGQIDIPLVADKNHSISKKYGVLLEQEGISLRGLFIIDGKGIIRQITINDLPVGRNVDEVLRLIEAFQFTDQHGEVCPIGWKKGDMTIKPDAVGSQEFFSEIYKD